MWWVLDLTGGRIPWADRNAKLSDRAKYYMYRLNKFGGCAFPHPASQLKYGMESERVNNLLAKILPSAGSDSQHRSPE